MSLCFTIVKGHVDKALRDFSLYQIKQTSSCKCCTLHGRWKSQVCKSTTRSMCRSLEASLSSQSLLKRFKNQEEDFKVILHNLSHAKRSICLQKIDTAVDSEDRRWHVEAFPLRYLCPFCFCVCFHHMPSCPVLIPFIG